jgi:hypothetical protein
MLRYHLRTLFGPWHLVALAGVLAAALLWPAASPGEQALLRWVLTRTEAFGPLVLIGLTGSILRVDGRVDERWGAVPAGLGGLFLHRWALVATYYALALGLFLAVAGARAGPFDEGRTFASALVTSALFALFGPLLYHRTGSPGVGWTGGLAVYFITMTIAMFWCPKDSTYQLWLPFAGQSDAAPLALAVSKGVYALLVLSLLRANRRILAVPERLIRGAE